MGVVSRESESSNHKVDDIPPSFVTHLDQVALQATSHDGVRKQVLLPSFGIAANVAALSVARIAPGQEIPYHHHPTMYEFFFVLAGQGHVGLVRAAAAPKKGVSLDFFTQNEETIQLRQGSFLQTSPGDYHSFRVDASQTEPLQMIYFGITTTDTRE